MLFTKNTYLIDSEGDRPAREEPLEHRQRAELRRSLQNPHPESAELVEQGLDEWTRSLPAEDTRRLLTAAAPRQFGGYLARVVELDPTRGREQHGVRPCVVVSDPEIISDQRFPLVCVLPITGTPGQGLLYPPLSPGRSGLAKESFALIDHLRSVDKRRIRRAFGELAAEEIAAIDEGLAVFLGLGGPLRGAGAPPVQ